METTKNVRETKKKKKNTCDENKHAFRAQAESRGNKKAAVCWFDQSYEHVQLVNQQEDGTSSWWVEAGHRHMERSDDKKGGRDNELKNTHTHETKAIYARLPG